MGRVVAPRLPPPLVPLLCRWPTVPCSRLRRPLQHSSRLPARIYRGIAFNLQLAAAGGSSIGISCLHPCLPAGGWGLPRLGWPAFHADQSSCSSPGLACTTGIVCMVSLAAAGCLLHPQRGSGPTHGVARLRFPAVAVLLWTAAAPLSLCYLSVLQRLFADALLQCMRMQGR